MAVVGKICILILQSKLLNHTPTIEKLEQRRYSTSSLPAHPLPQQHHMNQSNESSQAIVARIYEEELIKLAEQAKQSGNVTEYQLYQVKKQTSTLVLFSVHFC